jgi:hypothetical protein
MGQEKFSVEFKNTQIFSIGNPERKMQFGRSRRNVKDNVMNCM